MVEPGAGFNNRGISQSFLRESPITRTPARCLEDATASRAGALRLDPAHGETDQFRRGLQLQLGLDVHTMDLDGLHTQMQLLGDLSRPLSLADQLEHLE